jgi:hypothetical protein
MKTVILFLIMLPLVLTAYGQTGRYKQAMVVNIEKSKKATTINDFQILANSFARIAEAEQKEWTAWYYAAFYNLVINFQDSVTERRVKYISLAKKQIESGLKIKPDETELLVLQVMLYYAEMSVDPMKGITLLGEANEILSRAKAINPDNPRIYLEEAEAVYNMPPEFGGGRKKALPILLVAREKYEKFTPVDPMAPDWGKDRCEMLISGVNSQPANE